MPQQIEDFWPSLTTQAHSEAMNPEKFIYQLRQMHEFLNLVLKIAFHHLYRDPELQEGKQIYDSLFPKNQENFVYSDNPNDPLTQDFKHKILNYVNNFVLSQESLPTVNTDDGEE